MKHKIAELTNRHHGLGLLLMVILIGFSGCTTPPQRIAIPSPTQKALIGKTKQEILACAIVQPQERVEGDLMILRYYKEASMLEESFPGSKSSVARIHHGCWATLGLRNDRVEGVQYESVPSSYEDEDHCDEIFLNCLGP